jgi:hypothetical protein
VGSSSFFGRCGKRLTAPIFNKIIGLLERIYMAIWYTFDWGDLHEVDVIRETPSMLVYKAPSGRERRMRKDSVYPTKREAYQAELLFLHGKITSYEKSIERLREKVLALTLEMEKTS